MKRIVALIAALALISTTSGCGCCRWAWPGGHVAAPPVISQYAPACNTCNTCPSTDCGCDSCGTGGVPVGTPYGAGYGAGGAGYGGSTVYDGGYSSGYFPQ